MSISLEDHENRIDKLEKRLSQISQTSGKLVKLWSGSFGGGTLTLPGVNFSDYSLVIAHVDCENIPNQTSIIRSANLICPTYDLGGYNYDSTDLIGDDAAGMWLSSSNQVSFHAWAGVWIKNIYALKM